MVDTTTDISGNPDPGPTTTRAGKPDVLSLAGLASIAAGVIHATAAGAHSEHEQTLWAFVGLAGFQICWGALALVRSGRLVALVGAAGNLAAVAGWGLAKTEGIGFIDGLEETEKIQLADGLAAGLAAVSVLLALVVLAGRSLIARQPCSPLLTAAALASVVLALPGMVSAGNHGHAGGPGDDHAESAGGDHAHGAEAAGAGHTDGHSTNVPPKAYDPTLPIDLSGVEGVSPEQQARAENLIAYTLADLPQFADPAHAFELGYRSIGDGATGYEHFIKWDLITDDKVLDPDFPEALVYRTEGARFTDPIDAPPPPGTRHLESAMFMLPPGSTLETVPDVGGPLTQWHRHTDLCFTDDPAGEGGPRVAAVVEEDGVCQAPLQKLEPVPMIHVWIVPHPCGPFAALEGVGAGQVAEGETKMCDHAHGSGA